MWPIEKNNMKMEYDEASDNYVNGNFTYPKSRVMESLSNILNTTPDIFVKKRKLITDLLDNDFEINDPVKYLNRNILVYLECFKADELLFMLMRFFEKYLKSIRNPTRLFYSRDQDLIARRLIFASNIEDEKRKLLILGIRIPSYFIEISKCYIEHHQKDIERIIDFMILYQGFNPLQENFEDSESLRYAMKAYHSYITLFIICNNLFGVSWDLIVKTYK